MDRDCTSEGYCPPGLTCALDGPLKGKCVPDSITAYSSSPPFESLPDCMKAAISRSQRGEQTPKDDALMGKLGQPYDKTKVTCHGKPVIPYCQQHRFASSIYCACQNVRVPHVACIFAPCQNSPFAYKTVAQQKAIEDPLNHCPEEIVCENIVAVGGKNNVVQAYQTSNCGTTREQIKREVSSSPKLYFVLLFVVAVLAAVVVIVTEPKKGGKVNWAQVDGVSSLQS